LKFSYNFCASQKEVSTSLSFLFLHFSGEIYVFSESYLLSTYIYIARFMMTSIFLPIFKGWVMCFFLLCLLSGTNYYLPLCFCPTRTIRS